MVITAATNESQVPLPALRNTSRGSSAMAAEGRALATDWASTSGIVSMLRRRVPAPAALDGAATTTVSRSGGGAGGGAPTGLPAGTFVSDILVTPSLVTVVLGGGMVACLRHRDVQRRVAVEEALRLEMEPDVVDRHH